MNEDAPGSSVPGDAPLPTSDTSERSSSGESSPPAASSEPSVSADGSDQAAGATCQNCGASLHGDYCHACGQRHLPRLQVRTLIRTFADALLDVADLGDGLWTTLWEGARNPGRLARRYVEGERQRFVNPISYVLIAITLLFVAYVVLQEEMVQALTEMYRVQLPAMGVDPTEVFATDGMYRQMFGWESMQEMAASVLAVVQQMQTYVTLIFCLLAAGLLRVLTSGYTYAELVVFELYATGQAVLYHVLALPIFLFTSLTYWFALGPVLILGMLSLSGSGFFDTRLKGWVLPPLTYIGAYVVVFFLVALISFLIGFFGTLFGALPGG